MDKIEFSKKEKEIMIQKVKMYFREELTQEIGNSVFTNDFSTGLQP
jgi:uncharacterized protein (DUF2164 family)